jgi:hypothetical protein
MDALEFHFSLFLRACGHRNTHNDSVAIGSRLKASRLTMSVSRQ